MIVRAIDPDLHKLAMVLVKFYTDGDFEILEARIFKVSAEFKGADAVTMMAHELCIFSSEGMVDALVIESQEQYLKSGKRPADLIKLAQVAGAALCAFIDKSEDVQLVRPADWKGQVEKRIMHNRIKSWYDGAIDEILKDFPARGEHSHLIDAFGMAYWYVRKKGVVKA